MLDAILLSLSLSLSSPPVSGDALLSRIVAGYREDAVADAWDRTWMPARLVTRGGYEAPVSGDERMAAILSVLTRERLDAGGWSNPYVDKPGYAAEYALLHAPVGDGASTP